jgi:hypothetical protein
LVNDRRFEARRGSNHLDVILMAPDETGQSQIGTLQRTSHDHHTQTRKAANARKAAFQM